MLDIILTVLLAFQPAFSPDPSTAGQLLETQSMVAPAFRLKDLRGSSVRLSDYKGKVVLINFWATWCAPCQAEMPELIKLQNEYRTRGLQILGVTCPPERLAKVRRVIRKFKISYPVVLGSRRTTRAYDAGDVLPSRSSSIEMEEYAAGFSASSNARSLTKRLCRCFDAMKKLKIEN
jgi:thiol-disulfide isomerase/thioredoxin